MEVDEARIPEQAEAAAVASQVVMEQVEGGVVNQEPAAPAGALHVEEELGECLVNHFIGLAGKVASCDSTKLQDFLRQPSCDSTKLRKFLMSEENGKAGMEACCRKRKMDLLVPSVSALDVKEPASTRQRVDRCEVSAMPDAPQQSKPGSDMSDDIESSSNSSDLAEEEQPCSPVQAVELPPSSGDISVPEESINYLFFVYNFLRSFSVQLFLSPFGLDHFIAAINCTVQSNLLDAVHVSLLRALRRHLESKSTQLSSNCLKYLDWTLLDTLTWPTFLLEYLYVMDCIKNLGGQSFVRSLLVIEYYKLPVAMKLRVLQLLCDHVIDSEELKTELEDREAYNEEMEYETDSSVFVEVGSRAVSARASKTSAYKRVSHLQSLKSALNVTTPEAVVASSSKDGNSDCRICGMNGTLLRCDVCPWAYHSRCIGQNKSFLPQGAWFCPECVINKLGPTSSRIERGARGAQMFGIDMCGRIFLGSCNYLLVIQTSPNVESYARYYNHHDVVKVLRKLALSDAYMDICRQIKEYWKHLFDVFEREGSKIGKEVGAVSAISAKTESISPPNQGKHHLGLIAKRSGNMSDGNKAAKLPSFKPQSYMNLYNHGNIAASAASILAVITADQGASQLTTNSRKKIAADNALQVKVFFSAATQFVWPTTERKLMEVPRDRCDWCLACRSSAIGNKKACFLNVATANAARSSARVLSVMHVIKYSDSHFPSIVAYLANMEESLRGLLVGSLQDLRQKQRWHHQLLQASSCRTVIPLLLELESNIHGVAFSASWLKPIDDWPVDSPGVSIGASCSVAFKKCGASGRQGRKHLFASKIGTATDTDNNWSWWSGGNISKRILQRGALQRSSIRKAAREGGKKRIACLSYHEGSNFPRQSQQFAWRGCVGQSQTSSQLALQVRYLDAHIRWKEFIPPDDLSPDGKSYDGDFSAFRNAVICDKKIFDNKIRYALKFPNLKHLPVHVTKNALETEGNHNGNIKLWFSENHVPLFMLREFERKAGISSLPTPGVSDSNCLTNFLTTRVRAYTGDVFSYLFHKGDLYPCASCKKDVQFRDVVKCSSCQGNCHKVCTTISVSSKGGDPTSSLMCKLCLRKRNLLTLTSYSTDTSYIRPQQTFNGQQPLSASKIIFKVGSSRSAEPALEVEGQPVAKVKAQAFAKVVTQPIVNVKAQPPAKLGALLNTNVAARNITCVQAQPKAIKSKSKKLKKPKRVRVITYFGLVWKKFKNNKDDGSKFRANDVIRQSKDSTSLSMKPTCCLCNKTYSPDFLYVRCESCRNWFHGDALQLKEEKISELVAYRCCRCRKRTIPQCPHSGDYAKPGFTEQTDATSWQSTMLENLDPLLASYGFIEPIGEVTGVGDLSANMSSFPQGSKQKLSIRRA